MFLSDILSLAAAAQAIETSLLPALSSFDIYRRALRL